ncbi:MAG TPA: rod shape-determining protein MreD, partial [Cyanobacteria bacterium UBA8156]|nr:rod shape-determining protein MreD [Cyanobacteria bacterium UBA8156]
MGQGRGLASAGATLLSLLVCLWLMPMRLPGMTLLGGAPHWLLMWVVAWSLNRPPLLAAVVGAAVGLLQDGLGVPGGGWWPSHSLDLAVAGGGGGPRPKKTQVPKKFFFVFFFFFLLGGGGG